MSSIAKIFIFINFILSIAYMVIAGTLLAQKWDYKQMLIDQAQNATREKQAQEDKLKDAEGKVANLQESLNNVTSRAIQLNVELNKTKDIYDEAKRTNDSLNEKIANLEASYKEINSKIGEKDARINELETARDQAKEEKEDAIRAKESSEEEQLVVQTELNNIKGEIAEKEKIIQKQQRELLEAKQIIAAAEKQGVRLDLLYTREKPLDGFITAVSKKLPLVMISLGSDDNIQKGYQFTVFRGSSYIGTIVIEDVYKDASAARILKDKTRQKIQKGDSVTTRFGGTRG
jgi:myosin heavy subunit